MKRKIKVYQLIRKSFDEEGNILPKEQRTNKIVCIGTVITPKKDKGVIEEAIWDLFNWTCWYHRDKHLNPYLKVLRKGLRKYGYRFFPNSNAQGYCNSDIFFKLDNIWRIARSVGWGSADSYEEAVNIVIKQQRF